MHIRTISVFAMILCFCAFTPPARAVELPGTATDRAASALIRRVIPTLADQFPVAVIPTDSGNDVFEIESTADHKIALRGNNAVSVAVALHWYLKYSCNCQITWCGDQLSLPNPLSMVPRKIRIVTPLKYRVYLNYCTFSYSMAWWDWDRWQREIDWMALNGINMPLAITGQEAVWVNTFKRFGISDEQMRQFLVGPAFFAWQFMGNIDSHGGTLPRSWIDSHVLLGQQILARERELGMTPILQAFTGHVPAAYKQANPGVRIDQQKGWCSFKEGIYQMDPTEPVFAQIGKAFIQEQTKLFGTDHFYAADPFHEGVPPRSDADYLPAVGKAVFDTMTAADPAAIWVMQSWSLREPLAKSPPADRLLIMDLDGARASRFQNFWDRPFVSGMIQNFGGRTQLGGALSYSTHPLKTRGSAPSCVGLGAYPEGMANNPLLYDLLYEMAWRTEAPDLADWVHQFCVRRYGRDLPQAAAAWELLRTTAYSNGYVDSMIAARPALTVHDAAPSGAAMRVPYPTVRLFQSWKSLLDCAASLKDQDTYRFDLVDIGRQCLDDLAIPLQHQWAAAYEAGDLQKYHAVRDQFLDLISDVDQLVGTRREFLLGKWISDARRWGVSADEKNLFEFNARMQVTTWGPEKNPAIFDYSWREWSGLINGYYKPRWQLFFDELDSRASAGQSWDEKKLPEVYGRPTMRANAFYTRLADWEESWPHRTDTCSDQPRGEEISVASRLYEKYLPVLLALPPEPKTPTSKPLH